MISGNENENRKKMRAKMDERTEEFRNVWVLCGGGSHQEAPTVSA